MVHRPLVLVSIAALAPVSLGRYDLGDHLVLVLSSVLVAGVFGVLMFAQDCSPSTRRQCSS